MSLAGRSTGFLGWHRHKLKWLDADRKTYLTRSDSSLALTPLSASEGISLIVVPAGEGDLAPGASLVTLRLPHERDDGA